MDLNKIVNSITENKNAPEIKKSKYNGVVYHLGKWIAEIKIGKKKVFIGRYNSDIEAARARDKKAKETFGIVKSKAMLNFPNGEEIEEEIIEEEVIEDFDFDDWDEKLVEQWDKVEDKVIEEIVEDDDDFDDEKSFSSLLDESFGNKEIIEDAIDEIPFQKEEEVFEKKTLKEQLKLTSGLFEEINKDSKSSIQNRIQEIIKKKERETKNIKNISSLQKNNLATIKEIFDVIVKEIDVESDSKSKGFMGGAPIFTGPGTGTGGRGPKGDTGPPGIGDSVNFLTLVDTPSSFGAAGRSVIVNDDEDGLIFGGPYQLLPAPSNPSNVRATDAFDSRLKIDWNSTTNAESYEWQQRANGDTWSSEGNEYYVY